MWKPSRSVASPSMIRRAPRMGDSSHRFTVSRREEPLPGEAHVARRQPPPVVEPHARAQPEPVPPAVALREHFRGEPGHDPRSVERPRERLEEAGRHLAVLQGLAARRIDAPDDARDRHVEDSSARRPLGRPIRLRLGLSELGVVDVGRGAPKLEAPDPGAGDPVVHVVEERHEDRGVEQGVLELPVERLAGGRPRLGPRLLEEAVGLRRGEVGARRPVSGVEEREREVVGIVVVGDPAAEHDVDALVGVPRLEELGHRLRRDLDLDAEVPPDAEEGLRQRGVLVEQDRVDADAQPDRERAVRRERIISTAFSRGKVRLPAPGVVAEDPGRDQARGGQGEAPERSPDEVLRPNGAGERGPESHVRSRGAAGVEEGEVRVLLGRLDEAGAKARLAEDRLEILGQEVARDVELARRAGRPRSRRPRARPGTRSGPRAPAPSRSGGCARGRRARACAARPGTVPFRTAVHRSTRAPRRWPFADRSGGTGRSAADPRGGSRSPDRTARKCLRPPRLFRRRTPRRRGWRRRRPASVPEEPNRALERGLDGRRGQRSAVGEDDPRPQVEPDREPVRPRRSTSRRAPARGCPAESVVTRRS